MGNSDKDSVVANIRQSWKWLDRIEGMNPPKRIPKSADLRSVGERRGVGKQTDANTHILRCAVRRWNPIDQDSFAPTPRSSSTFWPLGVSAYRAGSVGRGNLLDQAVREQAIQLRALPRIQMLPGCPGDIDHCRDRRIADGIVDHGGLRDCGHPATSPDRSRSASRKGSDHSRLLIRGFETYSPFMLAALMTGHHFSISAFW
jgi:hypothetical protein